MVKKKSGRRPPGREEGAREGPIPKMHREKTGAGPDDPNHHSHGSPGGGPGGGGRPGGGGPDPNNFQCPRSLIPKFLERVFHNGNMKLQENIVFDFGLTSRKSLNLCIHFLWVFFVWSAIITCEAPNCDSWDLFVTLWWFIQAVWYTMTFVCHFFPVLQTFILFWTIPCMHGLAWFVLVMIPWAGNTPNTLCSRAMEKVTEENPRGEFDMLITSGALAFAHVGNIFLLFVPLLAVWGFIYLNWDMVSISYYERIAQMTSYKHVVANTLLQIYSPVLVYAFWLVFCHPVAKHGTELPTDLPQWPGLFTLLVFFPLFNGFFVFCLLFDHLYYVGCVYWIDVSPFTKAYVFAQYSDSLKELFTESGLSHMFDAAKQQQGQQQGQE